MVESWNIWNPIRKVHQLAIYDFTKDVFRFADSREIPRNNVLFSSPKERIKFENWKKKS